MDSIADRYWRGSVARDAAAMVDRQTCEKIENSCLAILGGYENNSRRLLENFVLCGD
jgi:hypothetical protein